MRNKCPTRSQPELVLVKLTDLIVERVLHDDAESIVCVVSVRVSNTFFAWICLLVGFICSSSSTGSDANCSELLQWQVSAYDRHGLSQSSTARCESVSKSLNYKAGVDNIQDFVFC